MSNTKSPELKLSRIFDAPREVVFSAWTNINHLKLWWGPKGFTMTHCTMDLKPGGTFHYCMRSPDGHEMWGKFTYHEIEAPVRLVFASAFSDSSGATSKNPFLPVWPAEILNNATFEDHGERTNVVIVGTPLAASAEELLAFQNMTENMQKGFEGTFAQLDEYLTTLS